MLLFTAGRRPLLAALGLLAGVSLNSSAAYGQAAAPATLRLEGLVATPRTLTAADLAALPSREQTTTDKDGKKHVYRGVALADVLHLAGAPAGKAIHGPVLAEAVLAAAADGYQAVFALPEIDADFSPQTILLASSRDGQPLPPHDGPYQLIVPLEKKPARWVRQLTSLKVVKVQ
ncbi:hypothetical protein A0257_15605 [Hymenobacter psoromatis]|nr:hypothetical protein A0257_15605 [Hymenobacter psoromatis]